MPQKEFPHIDPKDPQTLILLHPLQELSQMLMIAPDERQRNFGAMIHLVSHAPIEFDYLLFRAVEGVRDLDEEFRIWYNTHVHSKGQAHMLKVLNREIGSLQPFFDSFQIAFYHINEHAKRNEDWAPINGMLWAIFCSLFDAKKFNRLSERFKSIISDVNRESRASMN